MKVGECENEDTDGKTHHDDEWDVVVVVTDARDANQWHEINVDKGKARDKLVPFWWLFVFVVGENKNKNKKEGENI